MTVGHWYDGNDLTELGHGYGQNLLGRKSLSKLEGWPDLTQIRFNTIVLAQPLHRVMRVYASARKASCQLSYVLHWPIGLCDPMMLHQITTLLRMIHPSPTPQCACSPCNSPSGGKEEIQFEAKFSHIKFGNLQVAVEQTLTAGTVSTAQFCVGPQNNMGMDQYLLIPFLGGRTSIYQLFWCSPGVQGFDTLPYNKPSTLECRDSIAGKKHQVTETVYQWYRSDCRSSLSFFDCTHIISMTEMDGLSTIIWMQVTAMNRDLSL